MQHPEYLYIKENSKGAVNNFKTNLAKLNIYDKLTPETNGDPDVNYNAMHDILTESMYKYFPIKTVKFNKRKHNRTKWITSGIIKSINNRYNLYRKLKETSPDSPLYYQYKINLRTLNIILKRSIFIAKKSLSNSIKQSKNRSFKEYLKNPPTSKLTFKNISEGDTLKIIHNLNYKKSSGRHDGLSLNLLKDNKLELAKPITLIINQSLKTGIFPDKLKIAKITPIHKQNDKTRIDDYRPSACNSQNYRTSDF